MPQFPPVLPAAPHTSVALVVDLSLIRPPFPSNPKPTHRAGRATQIYLGDKNEFSKQW
jgi:hypothetical protein